MRFSADSVLPFPREVVYRAYRDELQRAVPFMPNVVSIELRSDEVLSETARRLVKVWTAGGDIPAPLRAFLPEGVMRWDDVAVWDETRWSADWDIHTHLFADAVRCRGATQFVALGPERCRVEMHGELALEPRKIAALPAAVASPLVRTAEGYLSRQITANLASTADAITRYLRGG